MSQAEELASITGLVLEQAAVMLEATAGDLAMAVQLHFDGEDPMQQPQTVLQPPQLAADHGHHRRWFTNSVVRYDRPDPGVNRIGKWFYLVSTGKGKNGGAFPLLRSLDLVEWEEVGTVFPSGGHPVWSANTDFWAPEIHQVADGKVHVYFSARDPHGALHVGVAVADSPLGPYHDPLSGPLVSDPHWAIDASYFLDGETRKQYVLWKIDGNAHRVPSVLKIRELDSSGTHFAEGSVEHQILSSDKPWEHGVVEGPWLLKRGSYYYLFYSVGCFAAADYGVAVARSTALTGPYTKCSAPILCSGKGWAGPGHCVVISSPSGGDVMVYHAHQSSRMHHIDPGGRHVLVDRVHWHDDGWPRVGTMGTPTAGEQPPIHVAVGFRGDPLRVGESYNFRLIDSELLLHYDGTFRGDHNDDVLFIVREGRCPGGTISLEAAGRPGEFLRHAFGQLVCHVADGSELFHNDATWQVLPGMQTGSEAYNSDGVVAVSLRSINFPQNYVTYAGSQGIIHPVDVADLRRLTLLASHVAC